MMNRLPTCRFFLTDSCTKGSNCRFLHQTEQDSIQPQQDDSSCISTPNSNIPFSTDNTTTLQSSNSEMFETAIEPMSSSAHVSLLPYSTAPGGQEEAGSCQNTDQTDTTTTKSWNMWQSSSIVPSILQLNEETKTSSSSLILSSVIADAASRRNSRSEEQHDDGAIPITLYNTSSMMSSSAPTSASFFSSASEKKATKENSTITAPMKTCTNDASTKSLSWAEVVNGGQPCEISIETAECQLCPFALSDKGVCQQFQMYVQGYVDLQMRKPYLTENEYIIEEGYVNKTMCCYLHGDVCELCGTAALHPTHEKQRKAHHRKCLKSHEEAMEITFAIATSATKTCGICMDVISEKNGHEARFGILTSCTHCYCLQCIRKWRSQAKQYENEVVRSCPECRKVSDFVVPSQYWIEENEAKNKLIEEYKKALQSKECKYYKRGKGECPFGNKCFYSHLNEKGEVVDVGDPPSSNRSRSSRGGLFFIDDDEDDVESIIYRHTSLTSLLAQYLTQQHGGGGSSSASGNGARAEATTGAGGSSRSGNLTGVANGSNNDAEEDEEWEDVDSSEDEDVESSILEALLFNLSAANLFGSSS